jgi:adenylate kinase
MRLILYGPEGSGKGTQAKLLSEKLGIPILTSGDLVRNAAVNDTGHIGDVCRSALENGTYVADEDMFILWKQKLKEHISGSGWILDGFPRNVGQAVFLDTLLSEIGQRVDRVIYISISEEESLKRLIKRARPLHSGSSELHDSPGRIQMRLNVYKAGQKELLDYYHKKNILIKIQGERSIEEVNTDIISRLP